MSSPLFSIVTVTLNCAQDACKTAQSVLVQDFVDYEYIVKDGCSSDTTVGELRSLGVEKIHVSKDTGIYPAMNQALELCKGRYVWYLNAGDTFASQSVLSKFASHIQRQSFPSFAYGDWESMTSHPFWGDGNSNPPRVTQFRSKLTRFYLYRRTICHQAWAVERTLYQACGGLDERLRFVADYDFLLKVILKLNVSYSRVPCVSITYAAGGDAERNQELARLMRRKILSKYFSPWERVMYEALSRTVRLLVHGGWFSRLQRQLPQTWQARLSGL